MHYYKKNIGDYHKKAGRLSMLEHGAYTLLLDACYDRERFPTLEDAIDWTWARTEAECEAVRFVLSKFFVLRDGVYVQERIAEEIAKYRENAEKNAQIAKEREAKRKQNTRTVHEASPQEHEAPPNQEPRTNNQEPNTSSLRSEVGSADAPLPAKPKRKTSGQIEKPEGVTEQTWDDWMALRKRKGAPVTTTVLNSAIREAEKARISLEDFLQIWCFRGSQGLQADWIKPHELAGRAVMGGMQVARPLNKQEALEARNRAIGEEWARDMMRREGVLGD